MGQGAPSWSCDETPTVEPHRNGHGSASPLAHPDPLRRRGGVRPFTTASGSACLTPAAEREQPLTPEVLPGEEHEEQAHRERRGARGDEPLPHPDHAHEHEETVDDPLLEVEPRTLALRAFGRSRFAVRVMRESAESSEPATRVVRSRLAS